MECRKCHGTIPNDSVFCPFCGDDIREQRKDPLSEANAALEKARKTIKVLAVACVVLFLFAAFEFSQVMAGNNTIDRMNAKAKDMRATIQELQDGAENK